MNNPNAKDTNQKNPYFEMGWVRFIVLTYVFWLTFPLSLVVFLVFFGLTDTKFFLLALWRDFWQTVLLLILAIIGAIWGLYELGVYLIGLI